MTNLKTAARRLVTSSCLEKLRDPSIRHMKVAYPRLWAFVPDYYFPFALIQIAPLYKVTGILLMNGIRNLSSTDKKLETQSQETGRDSMTVLDPLTRGNKYNHL